jgi:two-component system chemotaxis response regulator CheB
MKKVPRVESVFIGASAGGMEALKRVLASLPADFSVPVVVVQHMHVSQDGYLVEYLDRLCAPHVKEADDKELLRAGFVYFGPPNYHLLVEGDRTFSLSTDDKVNHSRPSIDVLFESAAEALGPGAVGVVLTGASRDGADGLRTVREKGGVAIVQDPDTAEFPLMPRSALETAGADHVLALDAIGPMLVELVKGPAVDGEAR